MAQKLPPTAISIPRYKLVVVGDGGCGKTSLLTVFQTGQFPTAYTPTIFETAISSLEVDGSEIEMALWDTAGQESYEKLRPLSYTKTDVVLICFSIDSSESFQNVGTQWAREVKHFCKGVPIILVGNKWDLREDSTIVENLQHVHSTPVSTEEIRDLATKLSAHAWIECSAKLQHNVRTVFETAARAAISRRSRTVQSSMCCEIV